MHTQTMDLWAVSDPKHENGVRIELAHISDRWHRGLSEGAARLQEVEVDVPTINLTREQLIKKAIDTLRERKQKVMADAQQELDRLDARISDLLQLTHQSL